MKKKRFRNVLAIIFTFVILISGFVYIIGNNSLTVTEASTKIKLNKSKITLYVGDSDIISGTCKLKISGAGRGKVKWFSSNKNVAIVYQNGKVTAKHTGNAIIKHTFPKS